MAERIAIRRAAAICGVNPRTLRAHAERGEIPGAARLFDGYLTFDEAKLRAWISEREEAWQETSTASQGVASGTPAYKLGGANTAEVYLQLISPKQESDLKRNSRALNKSASPANPATPGRKRS